LSNPNEQSALLKDSNLHVIFGITLTAVMGVASIAPALPSIARSLDVSTEQIGLLITFYTLPGIVLVPILGILADRIGRKVILVPSLFVFAVFGTACAFTTSFEQLLLFRVLQGFGSAALGTLNVALIGDLFTGNRRATAIGYNGSVLSLGTASYPAIGGALAILGWNYPFYLSLLAIPVGIFAITTLRPVPLDNGMKLSEYFKNIRSALWSKKVLSLFLGMFLTFIMLYGTFLTFFPILLDEEFGKSSFLIGIILSGSSLITAVAASQLGRLTRRFSESSLILTASVLYLIIFLIIPTVENIWFMIIPVAIFGLAQGINIPSILNLLTGQAPPEYRAAFLSVNWLIIRIGQALGPYMLGIIYLWYGIDGTFYFSAWVSVLFILVNLFLLVPASRKK
jgi:MFS transporter, ACDE family, multidrug resistance protein